MKNNFKRKNHRKFNRNLLPDPLEYYKTQGIKLIGYSLWRASICPFHEDRKPSLSINIQNGGYFCHGCGAKGGDVLDFHRRKHNLSFLDAAKDLNALMEV